MAECNTILSAYTKYSVALSHRYHRGQVAQTNQGLCSSTIHKNVSCLIPQVKPNTDVCYIQILQILEKKTKNIPENGW